MNSESTPSAPAANSSTYMARFAARVRIIAASLSTDARTHKKTLKAEEKILSATIREKRLEGARRVRDLRRIHEREQVLHVVHHVIEEERAMADTAMRVAELQAALQQKHLNNKAEQRQYVLNLVKADLEKTEAGDVVRHADAPAPTAPPAENIILEQHVSSPPPSAPYTGPGGFEPVRPPVASSLAHQPVVKLPDEESAPSGLIGSAALPA